MKTITEYRPMIFSHLAAQSEESCRRRRRLRGDLLAAAIYGVVGLALSFDTGFAPWQWQFWLMFAPLFVAGELAWRTCRNAKGVEHLAEQASESELEESAPLFDSLFPRGVNARCEPMSGSVR